MNTLNPCLRELAWWMLTMMAAVGIVLELEVELTRASGSMIAAPETEVQPVEPHLLPDYAIPGNLESRRQTLERTLFNPTRRPAPAAVPEAVKPTMQRGQFVLTGTTVVDDRSTAFLREVKGGKLRRVQQGDTINGLIIAEVKADRIKLSLGDESEELTLRVVANPVPTPGALQQQSAVPGGVSAGAPAGLSQRIPVAQGPAPDANVKAQIEQRGAGLAAVQDQPPHASVDVEDHPVQLRPMTPLPPGMVPQTPSGPVTVEQVYQKR